MDTPRTDAARLITSQHSWIEGEALSQLQHSLALPHITMAVGLPDLHPGKGTPVGAAFFSPSHLYPFLIGSDIGCGISLWQTELTTRKNQYEKLSKKLRDLESPPEKPCSAHHPPLDPLLGTLGGGNHFVEVLRVEDILWPERLQDLQINPESLLLMIHSGSRSHGDQLYRHTTAIHGKNGLPVASSEAQAYLHAHNSLLDWAKTNRTVLAERVAQQLKTQVRPLLDICHNSIEQVQYHRAPGWLHRKGAATANQGPVMIPGSRGSLSYLVEPIGDQQTNLWSLPHGAGRKWARKSCKDRLERYQSAQTLQRTALGSVVICNNRDLLYQEAPQAYKAITSVIDTLCEYRLVRPIASFRPCITYKTRRTT